MNKLIQKCLILFVLIGNSSYSFAKDNDLFDNCPKGSPLQLARSHELEIMAQADEADRQNLRDFEKI